MLEKGISEDKAKQIRQDEKKRMLNDVNELAETHPEWINNSSPEGITLLHIAASKGSIVYHSV